MKRLLLAVVLCSLAAAPARAAFEHASSSIKAEGLGGAFVALGDDPTALLVNPAGLVSLECAEASMMYSKPLAGLQGIDLSAGYLIGALPVAETFALGAGVTTMRAAGLLNEQQLVAGGGWRAAPWLAVGGALSYLRHSYEISSDPAYSGEEVFAGGNSAANVSVHAGVLVSLEDRRWQFGASARNLNRPDVGLRYADPVQRELRVGALRRFSRANLLAELERDDTASGTQSVWKLGLELPFKSAALRAGVNSDAFTLGAGLRLGAFGVDYAFALMRAVAASNYGSQTLALSYRFESVGRSGRKPALETRPTWVW